MARGFLSVAACVCILFSPMCSHGLPASSNLRHAAAATEYYVDCGTDGTKGDGRSPAAAWHSVDEVNGHTFLPGDLLYFKRGTECHGMLWPKGSGSASANIRLTAYGAGARPKVIAGKDDEEAFKLFDQQYWDVDSIEFSGGRIFGMFVSGQTGILHHIHLRNLVVHDVHGSDVKHKESGLVVISPSKVEQHFDDVLVDGITAFDTNQWSGILVGGGNFGFVQEKDWNTHVVVRNSVVHDVYGDGIILFGVKDGLIDSSAVWRMGMQSTQSIGTPNAIWTWMCEDCMVSHNEAFLTDSPGVDGGAYDIDYGNTRNSVVDNYAHDTQGYCVAVFAAGYVTHESVVEGNLCVNNGKSPRLAQYQGAIFVYTWNDGVIENLRVERNIVYWNSPGDFAPVLNRADIRGTQRVFGDNEVYSGSPSMLESRKNLSFQNNRYISCGSKEVKWSFDDHRYASFEEYRRSSGQEEGSSWKSSAVSACPNLNRIGWADLKASGWKVDAEIPASVDGEGFWDAAAGAQLVVLKNLEMQYQASGLRMTVKLRLKDARANDELLQNALGDLAMKGIDVSILDSGSMSSRPNLTFSGPDGAIVKSWDNFVGPAEIGLAVREKLGMPFYSALATDVP
jgi:hypothetical protein